MGENPSLSIPMDPITTDFPAFLDRYRERLKQSFDPLSVPDKHHLERGFPPGLLREIRECKPLSVVIPREHGGRGHAVHEFLGVLAASSYESLALSLTLGINGGLFLQPLAKYGRDEIQAPVFRRFLEEGAMGGLMITEPAYGSDALRMRTQYSDEGDAYRLRGVKHWAGLTGQADFWLVAARRSEDNGRLSRDIDFFVCDMDQPDQEIVVEEYYNNLGLYMIPYGRNRIDIAVPKEQRLEPETTGLKMMLDMLHRSRAHFPGMGMGFLNRMLDEAVTHCQERVVGGKKLIEYDQAEHRLARLQAWFTACSAMCTWSSENASVKRNLAKDDVPCNAIKSVVTDFMHDASQSLLQLMGAKGYRLDHIAGRAMVDSRPFQIFEGSNDILYQQISEGVIKSMRRLKATNLSDFLAKSDLTHRASDYFKEALDFEVSFRMPQRKLVDLGRVLGRIISMEMVIEMGDRGFRADLVKNCLSVMKQDVESILASYEGGSVTRVVEDYLEGSSWLDYLRPQKA